MLLKALSLLAAVCSLSLAAELTHDGPNPDQARWKLVVGNKRYAEHKTTHPHQTTARRLELNAGQHPFAVVVSCSDSRVPPELVFDEGLGDLFVVRVAGNVVDEHVIGSVEYAAEHLHVPLVVVMGHKNCGAVNATIDGGEPHDHVKSLVEAIKPAVEKAKTESGVLKDNAVVENVRQSMVALRNSQPTLTKLEEEGLLKIIGAVYDMETGKVEWIKD